MRTEVVDEVERLARKVKRFASLPIEDYCLTHEEQQELVRRGMSFTVDRMNHPHCHLSDRARAEELRKKVMERRKS